MVQFTSDERQAWLRSLLGNPASGAMLLESQSSELLIVKSNYKGYWSLPGGVIDPGEAPKQAALRETKEEVGLTILPDDTHFVGVVYRKSRIRDTYQFIFKASIDQESIEKIVLQASEVEEHAFVSKEQVKSSDRPYAPAVKAWADDSLAGYSEQIIDIP